MIASTPIGYCCMFYVFVCLFGEFYAGRWRWLLLVLESLILVHLQRKNLALFGGWQRMAGMLVVVGSIAL